MYQILAMYVDFQCHQLSTAIISGDESYVKFLNVIQSASLFPDPHWLTNWLENCWLPWLRFNIASVTATIQPFWNQLDSLQH